MDAKHVPDGSDAESDPLPDGRPEPRVGSVYEGDLRATQTKEFYVRMADSTWKSISTALAQYEKKTKDKDEEAHFGSMRNETKRTANSESELVQRAPFKSLVPGVYFDLVKEVQDCLDKLYPNMRPWTIVEDEFHNNAFIGRDYIQYTRKQKRQPFHWDSAASWYKHPTRGFWSPLSVIVHLNDGPATLLGGPTCSYFSFAPQTVRTWNSAKGIGNKYHSF